MIHITINPKGLRIPEDAWDFPLEELDYLCDNLDGGTFLLLGGRLYETESASEEPEEEAGEEPEEEAGEEPEEECVPYRPSLYEAKRAAVYATGNRWAIEAFEATH